MFKKNTYYISKELTETEPQRFEVIEGGKPVVIFDWLDTFIFKDEKIRGWIITELRTGTSINLPADTQKKAIERAKENIELVGKETMLDLIEKMVVKYGEAPKIPVDKMLLTAPKQTDKITT